MSAFPLSLEDLLTVLAARGTLKHLSLTRTNDGDWQASVKRPSGPLGSAYKVVIKTDVIDAVFGALGPEYGETWVDVLGPDFATIFDGYVGASENEDEDEDEEDLLG